MKYKDFEDVISTPRMSRYLASCNGNTKKAMTLYRKNLKLSQEFFTLISCFEIALRNRIDKHYSSVHGNDWLKNAITNGGIFDSRSSHLTKNAIYGALNKLGHNYSHDKLVAELGFGFWRFMFARNQYRLAGQTLLQIFPARPRSSAAVQYNNNFTFNELEKINRIRNRIAHHEPICFNVSQATKSTIYAKQNYAVLLQLFQWMSIDESTLLYGLDHIYSVCNEIENL